MYGVRNNVKSNLHIDTSITTQDSTIDRYLTNFGNYFDNQVTGITAGGTATPITTPVQLLNEINSLADRWATCEYKIWNPKTDPAAIASFNQQLETVKKESRELIKNFFGLQNEDFGANLMSKTASVITGYNPGTGKFS